MTKFEKFVKSHLENEKGEVTIDAIKHFEEKLTEAYKHEEEYDITNVYHFFADRINLRKNKDTIPLGNWDIRIKLMYYRSDGRMQFYYMYIGGFNGSLDCIHTYTDEDCECNIRSVYFNKNYSGFLLEDM